MTWTIEWDENAVKELSKLDRGIQKRIVQYLKKLTAESADPRDKGKSLSGVLSGLWRYRVGDFRLVCKLEDHRLVVLVVKVGHRRGVYR
ncbi:MAG: type II toxin-antitoxin system RelE/ParE family toxin [Acidobacteria bacterium]|nr:type II toxin-antitoxin system RelE/ParE family toxin [Acidobacteriota bacterium]